MSISACANKPSPVRNRHKTMFYSYFTACLLLYSVAWKVVSRNKSTFNLSDIFCKLLHQMNSVLCKDNFKVNKIQGVQNERNLLNYLNENHRTQFMTSCSCSCRKLTLWQCSCYTGYSFAINSVGRRCIFIPLPQYVLV